MKLKAKFVKYIVEFVTGVFLSLIVLLEFLRNGFGLTQVFVNVPEIYLSIGFIFINLIIATLLFLKLKIKVFAVSYIVFLSGFYLYFWYMWTYHFLDGL